MTSATFVNSPVLEGVTWISLSEVIRFDDSHDRLDVGTLDCLALAEQIIILNKQWNEIELQPARRDLDAEQMSRLTASSVRMSMDRPLAAAIGIVANARARQRRSGVAPAQGELLLRSKVLIRKHRFLGVLDDYRSLQRGLMAGVAGIGQMAIVLGKLGFILVLDGDVELEQRVPYDGLDQFHDPLLAPLWPLE
jgi:hypothetical protein